MEGQENYTPKRTIIVDMKRIFYNSFYSYMDHYQIYAVIRRVFEDYENYYQYQLAWMEHDIATKTHATPELYFGIHLNNKDNLWKEALSELLLKSEDETMKSLASEK